MGTADRKCVVRISIRMTVSSFLEYDRVFYLIIHLHSVLV